MKHLYIATIILSAAAYVLAVLVARDYADTWGYAQWAVFPMILSVLTLGFFRSWKMLVA